MVKEDDFRSFTDNVYKLYDSFKDSGFDKDQATTLTSIYLMEIKEYDRIQRDKRRAEVARNGLRKTLKKESHEEKQKARKIANDYR